MKTDEITHSTRLTSLSHGGGCGCKIAPNVLQEALSGIVMGFPHADLIQGSASADDAAVFRINDEQALVATTDFFMPIVDDPYDFGRIAATNALSDIYAMGATPTLALAIVGMPVDKLPLAMIRRVMEGGADACREAGIPLAGGHSIDSVEPIYGLAAVGLVHPDRLKRNDRGQPGDRLVLGKALGVGVLGSGVKEGKLDADGYEALIETTTRLNRPGVAFAGMPGVHALTDVTGFGLLGHLLEMCRGSGLGARVDFLRLPLLHDAVTLLQQGVGPGAIGRNWQSYGHEVNLDPALPDWAGRIACDPQTSGGLLVACAPEDTARVLSIFREEGFTDAAVIGELVAGAPRVALRLGRGAPE
ncbi:selenide, water dikinase SelD [Thioalkalivibrio paradoxus]|uniref:Selenide, water dikinase n=1 Tax=Thioalkalivibrio paradoxus ARh 1 TaxID=713585 RepID=W0DP85_9GAMM|nr:selenide, water dikinase SelD [Thioalkalivibrio paradoxus]AHE98808.1 segregation protein A [Thioalkalivibrio paradoxus ARh 1]